jgi:hypothetical protein
LSITLLANYSLLHNFVPHRPPELVGQRDHVIAGSITVVYREYTQSMGDNLNTLHRDDNAFRGTSAIIDQWFGDLDLIAPSIAERTLRRAIYD